MNLNEALSAVNAPTEAEFESKEMFYKNVKITWVVKKS